MKIGGIIMPGVSDELLSIVFMFSIVGFLLDILLYLFIGMALIMMISNILEKENTIIKRVISAIVIVVLIKVFWSKLKIIICLTGAWFLIEIISE